MKEHWIFLFWMFFLPAVGFSEKPSLAPCGICAHRGDSACFPENTIPAFQAAVKKGAPQVELDVCQTRDGHFVILHDPTVDRTTNGTGRVCDLTLEEIRALDAGGKKDPSFAGIPIPTLDEVLDVLPQDTWINVHLKDDIAVDVARKIKEKDRLHQAFLATTLEGIAKARAAVPGIQVCNMSRQYGKDTDAYARCTIENHCEFIQLVQLPSPEWMKALRDAGVHINYFPCNDVPTFTRLRAAGVDFVLTDNLDLLLKAEKERNSKE